MVISSLALEETNFIGKVLHFLFIFFRDFLFLLRKIALIMIVNLVKEGNNGIPFNSILALVLSFSFLLACKHQKPFFLEEFNTFDKHSTTLIMQCIMLQTLSLFFNNFFFIKIAFYIAMALNIKIIFNLLLNYFFVRLLQKKELLDKLPKKISIYFFKGIYLPKKSAFSFKKVIQGFDQKVKQIQNEIFNSEIKINNSTTVSSFAVKELTKENISKESAIIKKILENVPLKDSQTYEKKQIKINLKIIQKFFEENNSINAKINRMFANSNFQNCHQICNFLIFLYQNFIFSFKWFTKI